MPVKNEKEKKVLDKVMGRFYASRDDSFRQYKETVWDRCYRNYRGQVETLIPKRSNLFIPITYQTIETMVAREKSAIWSGGSLFKFNPRTQQDYRISEMVSEYAHYDISRVPSIYRKTEDFLRNMHIYGTSVFKVFWDYEFLEQQVNDRRQLNVIRDQFNVDEISVRNFYPDPIARRLDEARYIITRSVVDKEDFEEMVKRTEYVKMKQEEIDKISESSDIGASTSDSLFSDLDKYQGTSRDPNRQFVEILEYWSEKEDRLITIAGRQRVVRDIPIPFTHKRFPFVLAVDTPDPEHFWGLSTCETISDLQIELNAIRNNRMDKFNFVTNPMFKVKHTARLKREELASRQGGIVRVRDMDDVQPLQLGNMEQSDYIEENNVKQDIQTTSSITDFSLGQGNQNFNETATGISIISSNADARIIGKVQYLEEEVLKPMGYLWLSMQKQFMREKEVFFVTGQQWELSRKQIHRDFMLETIASSKMLNKQVRQNGILQMAQLVTQDPSVNHTEWLKHIFETFELNPQRFVMPPAQQPLPPPPGPDGSNVQAPQGANPNQLQPSGFNLGTPQGTNFITGEETG